MTPDDRFWVGYGKAVAALSFAFVFACAVALLAVCYQTYQHENDPVFTVAPDTLKPIKR